MKVLCVGDAMIHERVFEGACEALAPFGAEVTTAHWLGDDWPELQRERIKVEKGGPDAVPMPEAVAALLPGMDVLLALFCPVSERLLAAGHRLRVVGVCRAGLENVDVAAATRRGVVVLHVLGRNAEAVSDFAVGLMLCEARNMARAYHGILAGTWPKKFANSQAIPELRGRRVGLVGFGRVGQLVARKLSGFGVETVVFDPFVDGAVIREHGAQSLSLDDLMATSDVVSIHARLTPETRGLIGRAHIARMKPTAVLINTARAGLVDEDALVEALREHRIAGAGLDVFSQEPLGPDNPICHLDNVTLTSHLAGTTQDALTKSPGLVVQELVTLLTGGRPTSVANPEVLPGSDAQTLLGGR